MRTWLLLGMMFALTTCAKRESRGDQLQREFDLLEKSHGALDQLCRKGREVEAARLSEAASPDGLPAEQESARLAYELAQQRALNACMEAQLQRY